MPNDVTGAVLILNFPLVGRFKFTGRSQSAGGIIMVRPVVKRDIYTLIFILTPYTRMLAVIFQANRLTKYQLLQGFRRSVKNPEITQFAFRQYWDLIYSLIRIFQEITDIR